MNFPFLLLDVLFFQTRPDRAKTKNTAVQYRQQSIPPWVWGTKKGVMKVGLQTRAKSVILSFFAPSLAAFSLSCCFCFPQGRKKCLSAFFIPFTVKGCEKKKFSSERLLRQFSPSRFKFEFWTEKAILPSADVGRNEATPLSQPCYVDRV